MTPFLRVALLGLACASGGLFLAAPSQAAEDIDPNAPPPSTETLSAVSRYVGVHSTSEWHRFKTLQEAAMYDAQRLEDCSHHYECAGDIAIDQKGAFAVGPVHTDYISDGVHVSRSEVPSDWKLAAEMHSHPCIPHHTPQVFSEQDMMGAVTGRMTIYMVDLCSGEVHEFIPGQNHVDEIQVEDDFWLSAGKIIGHVASFPKDPLAKEGL